MCRDNAAVLISHALRRVGPWRNRHDAVLFIYLFDFIYLFIFTVPDRAILHMKRDAGLNTGLRFENIFKKTQAGDKFWQGRKLGTARLKRTAHDNTPVTVIGSFCRFKNFFLFCLVLFFHIFDCEPRNAQTIPIKTPFIIISPPFFFFFPSSSSQPVIIKSEPLLTLIYIRKCMSAVLRRGKRKEKEKKEVKSVNRHNSRKKERDRHLTGDSLINTCAGS